MQIREWQPAIVMAFGIGWLLFLYSLTPLGITPDSVNYAHAAITLLRSGEMLRFGNTPYTTWPPLYPLLLAGLLRWISDLDTAAKILHIGAYLLSGWWTWKIVRTYVTIPLLATAVFGWIMLGYPITWVHMHLWTEPLFIALTLGFVRFSLHYCRTGKSASGKIAMAWAALSAIQRYIGGMWIGWGTLWMWHCQRKHRNASRWLIQTAAVAALPLCAWILRNYEVGGTWMGGRAPATIDIGTWTMTAAYTIGQWMIPIIKSHVLPSSLLLVGMIALMIRAVRRSEGTSNAVERMMWATVIAYLVVVAGMSMITAVDPPRHRILAPIYPITILALGMTMTRWKPLERRMATMILTFNVIFWQIVLLRQAQAEQIGFFNHRWWKHHWLVEWYDQHYSPTIRFFSNFPEAFFVNVPHRPPPSLGWHRNIPIKSIRHGASDTIYLLWFNQPTPPWIYSFDLLHNSLKMRLVADSEGGSVWMLQQ